MSERFTWTEPALCHYNYDLSKEWFVYFDFTDTLTGQKSRKQFRAGINSLKTKQERLLHGNALRNFWQLQLETGFNPLVKDPESVSPNPKISEAFETILKLKEKTCSERTIHSYKYSVKLFSDWLVQQGLAGIFPNQFTGQMARSYMDHLLLKKEFASRTYNDQLTFMSTFLNCMIDRDWISINPFKKIARLDVEVGRNIAFTEEERSVLKDYLYRNDRPLYYFTQFMYYCFIRRSELTRLRNANIDWKNMTVVIPSSVSKNRKQESVVIPEPFVPVIEEMGLKYKPGNDFMFGRHLLSGPQLYANCNHISTRHNNISKSLGIAPEKGLYSWKHSGVCTLYPALNGDMYALMRQLRHSELTTTQIYLKSLGLMDNAAIRNAVW